MKAKLEVASEKLHEDIYNVKPQGEVSELSSALGEIEMRKARGVATRSKVKWNRVIDKCTTKFFKAMRQKKSPKPLSHKLKM